MSAAILQTVSIKIYEQVFEEVFIPIKDNFTVGKVRVLCIYAKFMFINIFFVYTVFCMYNND